MCSFNSAKPEVTGPAKLVRRQSRRADLSDIREHCRSTRLCVSARLPMMIDIALRVFWSQILFRCDACAESYSSCKKSLPVTARLALLKLHIVRRRRDVVQDWKEALREALTSFKDFQWLERL